MSDAAALVAQLAAAGTPPELLAAVAKELFAGETARETIDARRKKDRERHPRKSTEIRGNDGNPRNGAEIQVGSFLEVSPGPLPKPISSTPTPPKGVVTPTAEKPLTEGEVVEAWNERMVPQGFPAVRRLTAARHRQLKARLKENTLDDWQQAMAALERSAFCRGENDRGWRADFDFLLQPKSFTKLIEGAYDH